MCVNGEIIVERMHNRILGIDQCPTSQLDDYTSSLETHGTEILLRSDCILCVCVRLWFWFFEILKADWPAHINLFTHIQAASIHLKPLTFQNHAIFVFTEKDVNRALASIPFQPLLFVSFSFEFLFFHRRLLLQRLSWSLWFSRRLVFFVGILLIFNVRACVFSFGFDCSVDFFRYKSSSCMMGLEICGGLAFIQNE